MRPPVIESGRYCCSCEMTFDVYVNALPDDGLPGMIHPHDMLTIKIQHQNNMLILSLLCLQPQSLG